MVSVVLFFQPGLRNIVLAQMLVGIIATRILGPGSWTRQTLPFGSNASDDLLLFTVLRHGLDFLSFIECLQ